MDTPMRPASDSRGLQLPTIERSRSIDSPNDSAVSWGAIVAGAAAAAALSLILLILGTGLGLSSVSPWTREGVSATTFGVTAILWVTLTQVLASGMGGYIAGRLRTQWTGVHSDEVYFRDTAHGFLAWALASLMTAALLTSVIGSIIGSGVQATAVVAGAAAAGTAAGTAKSVTAASTDSATGAQGQLGYVVDSLLRRDGGTSAGAAANATSDPERSNAALVAESTRIFVSALRAGALPPADARYLGQVVAQRTGVNQQDGESRVSTAFTQIQTKLRAAETAAREAADKARKASAYSALWLFISLLIGAFVASLAATIGGRQRHA